MFHLCSKISLKVSLAHICSFFCLFSKSVNVLRSVGGDTLTRTSHYCLKDAHVWTHVCRCFSFRHKKRISNDLENLNEQHETKCNKSAWSKVWMRLSNISAGISVPHEYSWHTLEQMKGFVDQPTWQQMDPRTKTLAEIVHELSCVLVRTFGDQRVFKCENPKFSVS